jgi:hypothetical protein
VSLLGRERKVARGDWHVFAPVLGLPVLYYIGLIILYIKYVMCSIYSARHNCECSI